MRRNAFIGHPRPTPDVNKPDEHEQLIMDELRTARYTLEFFPPSTEVVENKPTQEQESMLGSK
jgi:hypothetical protein